MGAYSENILRINKLRRYLENPDSINVKSYETMRKTDSTVSAVIDFITAVAVDKIGEFTHPLAGS